MEYTIVMLCFFGVQYRRLDIYVVPYSQFPLTLLHFTGSGHFNRSMRHKADKLVSPLPFSVTVISASVCPIPIPRACHCQSMLCVLES